MAPLLWSKSEVDAYQPIVEPVHEAFHSRALDRLEANYQIETAQESEPLLGEIGIVSIFRREALELAFGWQAIELTFLHPSVQCNLGR